jgi:hypothetical protein
VFVVEDDAQIVGYILGAVVDLPEMFLQETSGFLADIYIEPPYRGRHGRAGRALTDCSAEGLRYMNGTCAHNLMPAASGVSWAGEVMVRMRADL